MDPEELKRRTREFAHRCVRLAMALPETALGLHVRPQLIRCGTSTASNYRAACIAQSKAAFAAKLSIVIEEVDESAFWMEFIVEEGFVMAEQAAALLKEAGELTAIFVAARKTTAPRQ